jgi:chromosome segregation ATPase
VADIDADIGALREYREALVRYRQAQRDAVSQARREIEKTRASLEAKVRRWEARKAEQEAGLRRCRQAAAAARAAGGYAPDCSSFARGIEEAIKRLDHIRSWQRKVEDEASAFRTTANRYQHLIDYEVPRAESRLLAIIGRLEAARSIQARRP